MQSRTIFDYILFGTELRYLQDVRAGWPYHGAEFVKENIERFYTTLEVFNLPVTLRASYKLIAFYNKMDETDEEHKLTKEQAANLEEIMDDIRITLEAEALGNVAFIVTDKRIDVNKLLNSVDALIAPDTFEILPSIAKYDFQECGKCIAFERPTAAAFHILRGTEDVLRFFYCNLVRRKRVSPLMWGPMVDSLRKKRTPPPIELLNNLDNIRRSFRNPTQHPDKVYDIQEAQDLFGLCIDVVNRMISYLKKHEMIVVDKTR